MRFPKQLSTTTLFLFFLNPFIFSATYYVTLSGNNANDGLSEGNAWRTITYAATQVAAGDLVYIKAGNYGAEKVTFSVSGTSGNLIRFHGYQTTPGDDPSLSYSPGDPVDDSVMPLLQGSNTAGNAFTLTGEDYIELKNIQISDYEYGIFSSTGSDNISLNNIFGLSFGTWTNQSDATGIYLFGTNNTIDNCIITDAGHAGFWISGGNNTVQNCKAYGHTEESNTINYYYRIHSNSNTVTDNIASELYGSVTSNSIYYYYFDGTSNTISGCSASNTAVQSEASFGFAMIGAANNQLTNCIADFIDASFYLSQSATSGNTFTGCTATGDNGFVFRNGPNGNTFNNCKTVDCQMAMRFQETTGGTNNPCAYNNIFNNCTFRNTTGNWVDFNSETNTSTDNNKFINCTIYNTTYLFDYEMPSSGNEIINCIFKDADHFIQPPATYTPGFSYSYSDFYGVPAFPANPDTNNIMFQPPVFVDEANGDFHLKASSPCIDAGTATNAPSTDFEGDSRPVGGGYDMGIDETPYTQSDRFFVTLAGSNSNDGLTEGNAWRTITFALTQIAAGDTVFVKAGNYGAEKIDFDRSGFAGNPIVFAGYQTTPGDWPDLNYQPGDPLDAAVMPLLETSDNLGRAFDLTNQDYIEIRNFQIQKYELGLYETLIFIKFFIGFPNIIFLNLIHD